MNHWGTFVQNGYKIKVYHTHYNGGRNRAFGREEWYVILLNEKGEPLEEIIFPFLSGSMTPSREDTRDLWERVLELFRRNAAGPLLPAAETGENPKEERHKNMG